MTGTENELDVLVIGAGPVGIHQLASLRNTGLSVRALEAGSDVGGTWYWNRYPEARLDSESYSYAYSFARELLGEWTWSEEFVAQPELERYYNFVVDKLALRDCIDFDARVNRAAFCEERNVWTVETEDGRSFTAKFVVATTGILSAPFIPDIAGEDVFEGQVLHTARWPKDMQSFAGKRVAVMGTGSTGIQMIQALAKEAAHLTVLQRTANWATPLNNAPITEERAEELRRNADDIAAKTMQSAACFVVDGRPQSVWDVSEEERMAYFEELWNSPGLSILTRNFNDVMIDRAANDEVMKFLEAKIRSRVEDQAVADKLIPKHRFGTKRPPLENGYYEIYNQPNVELVDLTEEPLVQFVAKGIETTSRVLEVDDIVLATGFDSLGGSFMRLGLEGTDGTTLEDWWAHGPRTYLGLTAHRFPNLFLIGPQGIGGNFPRCAEGAVEWITETVSHMMSEGYTRIEATEAAENDWVESIAQVAAQTVHIEGESWFWGSNIPGKARSFGAYLLPMPVYREKLAQVASAGYEGFERSRSVAEPVDAAQVAP